MCQLVNWASMSSGRMALAKPLANRWNKLQWNFAENVFEMSSAEWWSFRAGLHGLSSDEMREAAGLNVPYVIAIFKECGTGNISHDEED